MEVVGAMFIMTALLEIVLALGEEVGVVSRFMPSVKSTSLVENAEELIAELKALGVSVARERVTGKSRIVLRGPQGALTGAILTRCRRSGAVLRDHLTSIDEKTRADRAWAHQRGLAVPDEAPEKVQVKEPHVVITI